ncbi:stability/partitioning determinant [Mesorhizobium sp. L-2-11]|uniref:stability/partitioning determinant n=1 Tax=Mesorhizobium sp. L-2-11 TaxID=2744521 RepID=UPI001927464F|nr:stability/partitioning determinant [Mesorhizobium sp. L-2-11]BCH14976.1 hypothetical protein MesoLjLa_18270 [Mesorhizobium sp. L-2-11]
MDKQRADLGFTDAFDDFDPAEWMPRPDMPANDKPPKAETSKAAAAAGFRSREPQPLEERSAPSKSAKLSPPRGRRTGRNTQLNLKATPGTVAAFCAIADRQGWGLGETLEYAVALLEREYAGSTGADKGHPPQ